MGLPGREQTGEKREEGGAREGEEDTRCQPASQPQVRRKEKDIQQRKVKVQMQNVAKEKKDYLRKT